MIEKTIDIPESILKAGNVSYDNSASGLSATNVNDAIDEVKSSVTAVSTDLDKSLANTLLPVYKSISLSSAGWYRIAEYSGVDLNMAKGFGNNSFDIDIRKLFNSSYVESHTIKYRVSTNENTFVDEVSLADALNTTKIRVVCNTNTFKSYVDIYYNISSINDFLVCLSNHMSVFNGVSWNLIDPISVTETENAVVVLATHEFSKNKSYESEIETLDNEKFDRTGGNINGNVALVSDDAVNRDLIIRNKAREIISRVSDGGVYIIHDSTNGKRIIESDAEGTVLVDGVDISQVQTDVTDANAKLGYIFASMEIAEDTEEAKKQALEAFMTSSKCNQSGLNVLNLINTLNGGSHTFIISGNGWKYFYAVEITYYNDHGKCYKYKAGTWEEMDAFAFQSSVDALDQSITDLKNNIFLHQYLVTDIDAIDLPFNVGTTTASTTGTFPVGASKIGIVEVIQRTDQYIIQRYTDVGTNKMYIRWYFTDETGWRSWEGLATNTEITGFEDELKATDNTLIRYTEDNKDQALEYLNNPITIPQIGNDTRCYNFLFQDLVGDGPFNGGGITEIFGYTYAGGLYGFQMAFKYNMSPRWRQNMNGTWSEWYSVGNVTDINALDTRVTTLENQQGSSSGSSGDLSTSMVNVKTGNLVCNSDNLLICDIVPLGSNLLSGVHCDGKLYATNGVQVFISDFTSTMRTLQVSNGPITQLAVSVSTSGNGEVYIWAINSNRELGSGIYNHNDTSNTKLTINLFTPDILAMCQYDDKIYALSGSGEVYTNNNGMNPQMVLRVELDMDVSRINIVNGMLVAYGLDAMNIPRCAIYDLNTGEMLNPWIDDSEVRFTDVCYYQGGLIGYHYESCMFYRAECGNFYNPFVVSPENPITWRPFTLDVESVSNEYRLYGLGDYLIYATDMRAWVYNRKGTQYTLDSVSGLCDMIAINDGIYYIQQNGCHKILYETEELSLTEAFMRLTL